MKTYGGTEIRTQYLSLIVQTVYIWATEIYVKSLSQ